jgi:hypothetical protein
MAGVQEGNGSVRILFRYRGKQHTPTHGRVFEDEAGSKSNRLIIRLRGLSSGGLSCRPVSMWSSSSSLTASHLPTCKEFPPNRGNTRSLVSATLQRTGNPSKNAALRGSGRTSNTWSAHGQRFPIHALNMADLHGYVVIQAKSKQINGRRVSPATIKNEMVSLRTASSWCVKTP